MTPATMDVDYDTLRRASGGPLEDALISLPAAVTAYEKGTELVEKWEIDQAKKLLFKAYEVQDFANDRSKIIEESLRKANVGRYEGGAEDTYFMPLSKNMVNNAPEMKEMFQETLNKLREDIPGLPSNITFDIDGLNSMVKRIERRFVIASGGANGLVLLKKEAREAIERKEKREWEKADLESKHKHETDIAEKALQAKLNTANTLTRAEEYDLLLKSYKYAKKVSGKLYFSMQEFVNASEEEGGAPLKIKQIYWKLYGTPTGFTGAKIGEGFTEWKRDREKSLADLKKVPI